MIESRSVNTGEFLTRATIWIALIGYWLATLLLLSGSAKGRSLARIAWTVGCFAYACHVVLAFQFFYDWSHETAIHETARKTHELTGIDSGWGLYLNYFFTLVWIGDAAFWWLTGLEHYATRRKWILFSIHAFFIFMIINGTIIFANGPVRWLGFFILGTLLIFLLRFCGTTINSETQVDP